MDISNILENDGYHMKNPYYKKGNGQPEFIMTDDPRYAPRTTADLFMQAAQEGNIGSLGTADDYSRYVRGGITPSPVDDINSYELVLANHQSRGEKWKNSLYQTVINELLLGTVQSFTDLADVITGAAFRSDNDFQNPASRYLEDLQNKFRENHPIYVDPNKDILNGGLGDAGWWANNFPSIMSTLTLLIPASGVVKGISLGSKAIRTSTKASRALNKMEKALRVEKNTKRGIAARRMFENGVSATTMRTLENYQEARQVYDDMYKQASETLNNMSAEEYQEFLNRNASELNDYDINLNDRDAVARQMAHKSANKTFISDYQNLIFDVIQVNALRNPLKYSRNLRRTTAVNKAQRNRILDVAKAAGVEVEEKGKKSLLHNTANWFKDRAGAGMIVASELSEGVEEAVNYIAQQEGMHYGNVMFGTEEDNSFWNDRLWSYLGNGQLYDAAFWGVLGGVGFQAGGSAFNRVKNAIEGKAREKQEAKKGEKTKEKTNTKFLDRFMTSEDELRTNSMANSVIQFNELKDKLNAIKDHKDPYNKERKLVTEEEHEDARTRAIEDYMISVAFDAIDSGTWDLTKAFLRDSNVQEAMQAIGVTDSESGDIESMIALMDKIEDDYDSEITRVGEMVSSLEDVPFEYVQIIARDNAKAKQRIDRLNRKISEYQVKADEDAKLFEDNLDKTIDYKRAVSLAVAADRVARLNAIKKEINSSKEKRESVDGRQQLNEIDKELNLIYDNIINQSSEDKVAQLTNLMYVIGHASQMEFDEARGYHINKTSDEYLDFIQHVASGDITSILKGKETELGKHKFEVTDEEIIRLFGNTANKEYNGTYQALKTSMDTVFDEKNGLKARAGKLFDDYAMLSSFELGKIVSLSKMATTTESVNMRINTIHNWMNKARVNAIQESWKIIDELADKYGHIVMTGVIFSNYGLETIAQEDRDKLAQALEVLNLTSPNNAALAQQIKREILERTNEKEIRELASEGLPDDVTEENSSASEKPIIDSEQPTLNNPLPQQENTNSGQENGQNDDFTQQNLTPKPIANIDPTKDQKLTINITTDGKIDVDAVDHSSSEFGFEFKVNDDGSIEIQSNSTEALYGIPKSILAKSELFEGFDPNNDSGINIYENPILARDDNDNWYVVKKGKIQYNTPKEKSSILPTGVGTQTVVTPEGEFISKVRDTEQAQNELIRDVKSRLAAKLEEEKDNLTEESISSIIAEIKNDLRGKYDVEDSVFESTINSIHRVQLRSLKGKGLIKSSSEAFMSSIVELNGKFKFGDDFTKAVDRMISDYSKEFNLDKIDGKYYVSLEDLLRRINYLYDDKIVASTMFGAMVAYMQSDEGKQKFVVTDTNINSALDNAAVSDIDRRDELIGDNNDHRVDISDTFGTKAYASVREGDILQYSFNGTVITLMKNGGAIGTLPLPNPGRLNGYWQNNMGWIEEVWKDKGIVHSNLEDFYYNILTHKNALTRQLYSDLLILNGDTVLHKGDPNKLSDANRKALIDRISKAIYQLANNLYGNSSTIIDAKKGNEVLVEHLANVIRYFNKPVNPNQYDLWVRQSVTQWFTRLYNSYDAITRLGGNIAVDNNVEIKVSNITSGEVVRNVVGSSTTARSDSNYSNMTQSNQAFADGTEPVIGIINPRNENEFIGVEKQMPLTVQIPDRGKGYVYVVIKKNNRDSKGNYERENADFVVATGAKMSDTSLKGDAKRVFTAVKKEINYLIDEYAANPSKENFDKLNAFLHSVFYNTNKYGQTLGLSANTGLVFGVNYKYFDKNGVVQLDIDKGDFSIQINTGKTTTDTEDVSLGTVTNYFSIKLGKDQHYKPLQNNPQSVKELKAAIDTLLTRAQFNVSLTHVRGDRDSSLPNGLITRDASTRKITIRIPNSSTKSKRPLVITYNSFNDLVINGGFIRVNTHVENGSNYLYRGRNEAANQTLNVTIKTTTPVEKKSEVSQPVSFNIKDVFKNDIANIDDILSAANLPKETINLLKELNLLPKSITFAAELNESKYTDDKGIERWVGDNAQYVVAENIIKVGNKWIDMFNEEGEFSLNPKGASRQQAIRKLIHEQIHSRLHSDEKKRADYLNRIRDIYSEFEKYLNDNNVPADNRIRQYLFKGEKVEDTRFEEFLVESLTSKELANYLNNIKTDTEGEQKTLLQKVLDFIKEILGINVNKGSLLEKELNTIQGIFDSNVEVQENQEVKTTPRRRRGNTISDAKEIKSSSVTEESLIYYPSFIDFAYMTDNPSETINAAINGEINIRCK